MLLWAQHTITRAEIVTIVKDHHLSHFIHLLYLSGVLQKGTHQVEIIWDPHDDVFVK